MLSLNAVSFNKSLRRVNRRLRGLKSAMAGIAKAGVKALAAAFAIASVGVIKLARDFGRFDQAMRSSQAIMGDLTDALKTDMQEAAIAVAKTTKFSATQAAESYFFLASAGLDAAQSIAALPKVAKFAQAGMFDMALATDLLTDAQSALGLSVKDAQQNMTNMVHVSDVLVKANTLANASVQQFSEALTTKAGAALKIVNKDIEEGVAVLAAFADQGIKASEAGTALNIVFRDLQTKALKNVKQFEKVGVSVFDATGDMRNMADIIGSLETALDGMSDAQKKATLLQLGFSDKSVVFTQTLLGTSDKIRQYERALRSAGGTTADVADRQLTPFNKAMELLKGTLSDLGTALKPAMDILAAMVTQFAEWVDGIISAQGFTERFREGTLNAFEGAAKGLAFLLELMEAFRFTWLGIKNVALATAATIVRVVEKMTAAMAGLLNFFGANVEAKVDFSKIIKDINAAQISTTVAMGESANRFQTGAASRSVAETFGSIRTAVAQPAMAGNGPTQDQAQETNRQLGIIAAAVSPTEQ